MQNEIKKNKDDILGVKINNSKYIRVVNYISECVKKKRKTQIATPNPEMVVIAQKDIEFKKTLNSFELAIPDGAGIVWASKILGKNISVRISGIDLMESLCELSVENNWTIFLLGGRNGVCQRTKDVLESRYPRIRILGAIEGSPEVEDDSKVRKEIKKIIKNKKIDLLFVAYGASKQEKWISRNLEYLPVVISMGVGGAFDYISGEIQRAPKFLRKLGFEWLFRLIREPWRLKRQLRLIQFVIYVLISRIKL